MSHQKFWSHTRERLLEEKKAILAVMVHAEGSGPNTPGAKLVVFPNGHNIGTIGGGSSEFEITEKANVMLNDAEHNNRHFTLIHHDHYNGEESGMICGGEQCYALIHLDAGDFPALDTLVAAEDKRGPIKLILSEFGIAFQPEDTSDFCLKWTPDEHAWLYEETLFISPIVSIFGAGHVGLALSQTLSHLDFTVHIYDNRPDLPTMQQNTYAFKSKIIDYTEAASFVPEGHRSFVVIMTFGHQHDQEILAQLLDKPLKYLGMMGSTKKVAQIRNNLLEIGFTTPLIDRVHMPIGLPIISQTPEEIAISIAAQLIKIQNSEDHNVSD